MHICNIIICTTLYYSCLIDCARITCAFIGQCSHIHKSCVPFKIHCRSADSASRDLRSSWQPAPSAILFAIFHYRNRGNRLHISACISNNLPRLFWLLEPKTYCIVRYRSLRFAMQFFNKTHYKTLHTDRSW